MNRLRWLLMVPPVFGACTIASLPPSLSRTDGGPVATRGVVSHEARSQLRLYRDAAGCESVQTVSRQFRLVTVRDTAARGEPHRLVLEESYDVRHCLTAESSSSEALVTAWRPDTSAREPVFRLAGRGVQGEPVGNLYQMVASGCCGSQNLITYFSLLSGETLLSSSLPIREFEVPNERASRFVGFHDTYSAAAPAESSADSSVVGVLAWVSDQHPLQRVLVIAARPEPFALASIGFTRNGRSSADTTLTAWPKDSSVTFGIEIKLVAPASDRLATIRIPIVNLRLVPEKGQLTPGFTLRLDR